MRLRPTIRLLVAVLAFLANLLFDLASPPLRNPRAQESVKQIDEEQNRRHPFVVQRGEEQDENDGGKSRKRSGRPPGDRLETRIAQAG